MIDDKVCDFPTEPLARRQISTEMHPGKDSTQSCFLVGRRKTLERSSDSSQHFGSNNEIKVILFEEGNQDRGTGRADHGVSAGIGGIRGGVPTSGRKFGSGIVCGLPSMAASRIAVTGRQKL